MSKLRTPKRLSTLLDEYHLSPLSLRMCTLLTLASPLENYPLSRSNLPNEL